MDARVATNTSHGPISCVTTSVTLPTQRKRPGRAGVIGLGIAWRLAERATVVCQDLVELDLPEPVDAVFSNATFHWIHDHDALFHALARSLKPGGRLVAQCGGRGNIDAFRRVADEVASEPEFAPHFEGCQRPWNYAGAEQTAERLERAGFTTVRTWLEPKRVLPDRTFVKTVCLLRHLDPLPPDLRDAFIDRVLERSGAPLVLDYVRLNMTARKADV